MNRKLKFGEVVKLSKVLHDLQIKELIDELLSDKLNIILANKAMTMNEKYTVLLLELITYTITNIHKCEYSLLELIASYNDTTIEDAKEFDVDKITDCVVNIFNNGIPKVVKDIIKVEDIKKKMQESQVKETN